MKKVLWLSPTCSDKVGMLKLTCVYAPFRNLH